MCNQNENSSHLDRMNKSLLNDITTIIDKNSDDKVTASNAIMERLRGETIFIPKEYKDKLKEEQLKDKKYPVTINPYKCLPISLTQIENGNIAASGLDLIKNGVIQIKANSFGPLNPEEYFKINKKYRIIWLLKEPYIMSDSWYNGDRGGHNQAAEYRTWKDARSIPTYRNLIKFTKILLENLGISYKGEVDEIMNKVMSHICLLEVNHFPGLSFNDTTDSNDEYMAEWYKKNNSLLQRLVDFYDSLIIIFGHTLECFDKVAGFHFGEFNKVLQRYKCGLKIFDDTISEWAFINGKTRDEVLINKSFKEDFLDDYQVWRNIKYLGESGRCYMQVYHPTYKDFISYPKEFIYIDCNRIQKWMSKENEVTK